MLFKLSVILATVAPISAFSLPLKRQDSAELVTCTFLLIPEVPVDPSTTNLVAEFNFTLGRALSNDTGGGTTEGGSGGSIVDNPDGTFTLVGTVGVDGKTAAETAAVITGWVGETKDGLTTNWTIEQVSCINATSD